MITVVYNFLNVLSIINKFLTTLMTAFMLVMYSSTNREISCPSGSIGGSTHSIVHVNTLLFVLLIFGSCAQPFHSEAL